MGLQNSQIMICKNIKLDKSYKDVLSYTENQMLALCQTNAVASANNYSFIRKEKNVISTSFSYNDALKCNYMAFQNTDYSNKWFFAFIDDVEYSNDGTARIHYTLDEFSTWFDYWNPEPCFIEREHVNDDTIGLHTVPEGLEHGEYTNHDDKVTFGIGSCHAVVCVSEDPFREGESYPYNVVNSIPSGLHYFVVGDLGTSVNFIGWLTRWAANKSDLSLIQSIFMVPDSMTGYDPSSSSDYWSWALQNGGFTNAPYHKLSTIITGAFNLGDTTIPKPYNNIDGYIPKNKKLFVWPYNFLIVDNHGGTCEEFYYEDFQSSNCVFNTKGDISPGCSIRTVPRNYKHIEYNYGEGLNALKLPIGSWQGDVYTNWLTQNSVNIGTSIASSTAGIVGSAVSGNVLGAGAGVLGIGATLGTIYQHSRIPSQVFGNQNSGDVTYSDNQATFTAYKRTIKNEYARIIDEYFTRFGYKINRVKLPNQTGRRYWNFVKIGSGESIGFSTNESRSVPASSMDIINNIYRNGTTIWHDHANIGNYSLNNTIV